MKLQFYLFIVAVFISPPVYGESSLSAHLHGHVELNVAADGKTLFVEVHSPSQSFLGFEQRPGTDQQKRIWAMVKNQWEKKTSDLFQIDPSLACKVTQAHMDMHFEEEEKHHHHDGANTSHEEESHHGSEHSEIKAEATFLCNEVFKNSQLIVRLKKHFSNIEEIEVQALPNSGVPYSKTLKKDKAILDF